MEHLGKCTLLIDRAESYISPSAQISSHAVIEGKVIIGDNAKVLENAVIRGPAYIGPSTMLVTTR